MRGLVAVLIGLVLVSCGGASKPQQLTATVAPIAAEESVVTTMPAPAASLSSTEVLTFEGADGLAIAATLTRPGGTGPFPGVILLHMLGSERGVWADVGLVEALAGAGYAVLAVDMRGHGETGGAADWTLAADDLGRVWDAFVALDSVDDARTAVIGASIGANMALRLGVDRPDIRAVVALSPGLDYRGVTTAELPAAYGDRPLLLVASEDDAYAADSVRALAESAADPRVEMYATAGHGTNMFAAAPELTPLLIGWLDDQLAPR